MNFGLAFSYPFQDADWLKKVGIAAAVLLIPLLGPIVVLGWSLEIIRRVINDDPQPLPGWEDFVGFISKGFQAFVVQFAYMLPLILIVICGQVLSAVLGATLYEFDSSLAEGITGVVILCISCFGFIFGLLAAVVIPAALGNLAATGEVGAAFRFNQVFGLLRAAIGPYILAVLIVGGVALVLSPLGSLICGIGALVTSAYIAALSGHLYGQAYKIAKENVSIAAE
jgi:hypothetical protein